LIPYKMGLALRCPGTANRLAVASGQNPTPAANQSLLGNDRGNGNPSKSPLPTGGSFGGNLLIFSGRVNFVRMDRHGISR